MSVKATLQLALTVIETLASGVADIANAVVRHDQFNVGPKSLNSGSTPPASLVSASKQTNTQSLDFTNLPGVNGASVNGTGFKVQAILITNLAANTGAMTVAQGGANPLQLFGATITIPLGGTVAVDFGGNGPAVAGGTKNVLFTPNNAADSYNVLVLLG